MKKSPGNTANAPTSASGAQPPRRTTPKRTWRRVRFRRLRARNLSRSEVWRLHWAGWRDGRDGMVAVDADGVVTSAFANRLASDALRSIEVAWASCSGGVSELADYLGALQTQYDSAWAAYQRAIAQRTAAEQEAGATVLAGDADASDEAVARRRELRATRAGLPFAERAKACVATMDEIAQNAETNGLADLRDRQCIAELHEQLIEDEYRQKAMVYARSAIRQLRKRERAATRTPLGAPGCAAEGGGPIGVQNGTPALARTHAGEGADALALACAPHVAPLFTRANATFSRHVPTYCFDRHLTAA